MFVPDIEAAVEDVDRRVHIPENIVTALRELVTSEFERLHASARRVAFLDAQINAGDIQCDQAKAHLEGCLALAGDSHAIYMSMDDSLRRLANQAFFDKLIVMPDNTVTGQPGEPFNSLINPDVQSAALARQRATTESGRQTGNVAGLNNDPLVEAMGIEPTTYGLQSRRSAN